MFAFLWKLFECFVFTKIPPPRISSSRYAEGIRSRIFDYQLLDHNNVESICVWNDMVVTGSKSDTPLRFWTKTGNSILCYVQGFTIPQNPIMILHVWNDLLIVGGKTLQFWKLVNCTKNYVTIQCCKDIHHFENPRNCIIWDGYLWVTFKNSSGVVTFDQDGTAVKLFKREIRAMVVFQGDLWTSCGSPSIQTWKSVGQRIRCLTLDDNGHHAPINCFCTWGETRVASGSSDCSVRVWDKSGNCLMSLYADREVSSLATWNDKLVCGTMNNFGSAQTLLVLIWKWNGDLYQKLALQNNTACLLVHEDRLWQGEQNLRVWQDRRNWGIERLLWIGWKSKPEECVLGTLPKDIIRLVILLLRE